MPVRWDGGPWPRIRKAILVRDGYQCRIRGPKCTGTATTVDHIVPRQQAPHLVYEPSNLRAACSVCNSGRRPAGYDQGWQHARTRINLVIGPPGAGKSTYVAENARPGHLTIDYDRLGAAMGAGGAASAHSDVQVARNALLRALQRGRLDAPVAWLVSSNPKAEQLFPFHRVIVVDPGLTEIEAHDLGPDGERRLGLAKRWYAARTATTEQASRPSRDW